MALRRVLMVLDDEAGGFVPVLDVATGEPLAVTELDDGTVRYDVGDVLGGLRAQLGDDRAWREAFKPWGWAGGNGRLKLGPLEPAPSASTAPGL